MPFKRGSIAVVLVMISLAIVVALVSAVASLAQPAGAASLLARNPQQVTATPDGDDGSVAGSTDTIMWMGLIIVSIVLAPILLNWAMWHNAP
jgi:hypothetical protein